MGRWRCPRCDREFGREHQAHVCVPGCTVDHCFAGHPAAQREIYDAVLAHLRSLGPVHEDAVQVGVFLKSEREVAEVRPLARSLSLELVLDRPVQDPRVSRPIQIGADRVAHFIKLTGVDQVDDQVRDWLTEAYDMATDS